MRRALSIIAAAILLISCNGHNKTAVNDKVTESGAKIEVLIFHGAQRCATCKAIDAVTQGVLDSEYFSELKDSVIVYRDIDGTLKENEELIEKYEVVSTSIFLIASGTPIDLTKEAFTFARTNPDKFKEILRSHIDKALE